MGDLESKLEFFRKRGVFMILHIIILILGQAEFPVHMLKSGD